MNGDTLKYDGNKEYAKSYEKSCRIWKSGLTLGDMGTRRRFSFEHQERVLDALIASYEDVKRETEGQCGKSTLP